MVLYDFYSIIGKSGVCQCMTGLFQYLHHAAPKAESEWAMYCMCSPARMAFLSEYLISDLCHPGIIMSCFSNTVGMPDL